MYGTRKPIISSSTSPAKMLPKRRKDREIIFVNSPIISKKPIKKFIGLEKLIYLEIEAFIPCARTPITFIVTIVISARAKVKFRSLAGARKKGIIWCPPSKPSWTVPKEPIPGRSATQFEIKIITKSVVMNGKYFIAFFSVPKTEVMFPSQLSIPSSTTF